MKPRPSLKALFGKYAGQPLKDPNRLTCDIDTVLESMRADAHKNGLELRMLWPDALADFGHNPDRVNVTVDKDASGKMRVGKNFSIG